MAMAAAAFLRSVAAKMARAAPPRLPSALEERLQHHGLLPTSSNRLWLSRFSTSTGSTPPTNLRGPQTHNKEVPRINEWDWAKASAKAALINAAPNAAFLTVLSGLSLMYFWSHPELARLQADLDANSRERKAWIAELQQANERLRVASADRKLKLAELQQENERLRAASADRKLKLAKLAQANGLDKYDNKSSKYPWK